MIIETTVYEFNYAFNRMGDKGMQAVIMDTSLTNTRTWQGDVGTWQGDVGGAVRCGALGGAVRCGALGGAVRCIGLMSLRRLDALEPSEHFDKDRSAAAPNQVHAMSCSHP